MTSVGPHAAAAPPAALSPCEGAAAAAACVTEKMGELTMASSCIPVGTSVMSKGSPACCAVGADGQPPMDGLTLDEQQQHKGCRLAAVNKFTVNPDEPVRSLQELVQGLVEELSSGKKDLNRLYNLMMSYDFAGNEWKRFEFWDSKKKYTRNLIANVPGCLCLMLLCWNPEKGSPIHNHAGSECFMRVLRGRIVEQQFVVKGGEGDESARQNWGKVTCSNIPPSDLILTNKNVYESGGCTFINDSLGVHAIENPYKEAAITLHCYIPGYDTCKSWSQDVNESDPNKCVKIQQCHISYDTEVGERTHA